MEAVITITGNVGTEIELRGGGTNEWAYAHFRVASTRRIHRGGSWQDAETTWLGVLCRNRVLAENVKASLAKGDPVIVSGRLATSVWNDPETGRQERLVLEAQTVGHDLTRGTSAFRRHDRPVLEPPIPGKVLADLEAEDREPPEAEGGDPGTDLGRAGGREAAA